MSLELPASPADPPRSPFPVVASIAPVLAAGAIWVVTRSPFALVFAALSPVIAVASMVDGRWQARRRRRRQGAERRAALEALSADIRVRHGDERVERARRHPSATTILASVAGDVSRWRRRGADGAVALRIGSGTVPSAVRLGGTPVDAAGYELCAAASVLHDAAVVTDAAGGVGIVGPIPQARAVARGYLVQLVHALSPDDAALAVPTGDGWAWAQALPHAGRGDDASVRIEVRERYRDTAGGSGGAAGIGAVGIGGGGARGTGTVETVALIALADATESLPTACRTVIRLVGATTAEATGPGLAETGGTVATELITLAQAEAFAHILRAHAHAAGIGAARRLPAAVRFDQLPTACAAEAGASATAADAGLSCAVGVDEEGSHWLDLVRQGPHAVVGGTTGSGKSELLITWVTAMAATHSPARVTFLLIDFKGGAAFAPLAGLPHTVGVMTDLDHAAAARALASLGAELRYRERVLAGAGAANISDAASGGLLARLVIVVDEFAAMLEALPELHAVFTDVAARGRSLGVHLILCTQRPASAVRDSLLANCGLRLSLRVNDRADSRAVVGTDAAFRLPADSPGRCIVAVDGDTRTVQIAATTGVDIARVGAAGDSEPPRRPWLDPLPARIPLADLARDPHGFVLGLQDVPEQQRQDAVIYTPDDDGSLLVLGAHRSGKSTVLRSLGAQSGEPVAVAALGKDVESFWDGLREASAACARGAAPDDHGALLLAIDDVDSLYARLPEEYRQELVDMLGTVLRDGPSAGLYLAMSAQRLTGPLASLASLVGTTLLLRLANRQEHLLAGGDAMLFDDRLSPGGASWRGHRVQLAIANDAAPPGPPPWGVAETAPALEFVSGTNYLLVSRDPARRAVQLGDALGELGRVQLLGADAGAGTDAGAGDALRVSEAPVTTVVVGDPDAWQRQWSLLATLAPRSTLVFDGCTPAEARSIARTRELPPVIGPGGGRVWLRGENGGAVLSRARWPWSGRE